MITFPESVLAEVKKHLSEELEKVSTQIGELNKQDPFTQVDRLNDNAASDTEANEEVDHERFQALITELAKKRETIEQALERIKNGTYGICTSCGNLIDTDRLAAMPAAVLCINCQSKR